MIDQEPIKDPKRADPVELIEDGKVNVLEHQTINNSGAERVYLELSNFKCEMASNKLSAEILANMIIQIRDVCFNGSTKKEVLGVG